MRMVAAAKTTTLTMADQIVQQQQQLQQLHTQLNSSSSSRGSDGSVSQPKPLLPTNLPSNATATADRPNELEEMKCCLSLPMSDILRHQLEELRHLSQPLGTHLLSTNEQLLCKRYNLPPTIYMSLKTLLLSGSRPPVSSSVSSNLSPLENSLRKYFIQVGWLSH